MHRFVLLLAPALLASCAVSPTPNYDMRFGDAVRQARQAQILNAQPAAIVQGMDGGAAKRAIDRYIPPPQQQQQPGLSINIGNILGAGTPAP